MSTRGLSTSKQITLSALLVVLFGCATSGQSQTDCRDEWPGYLVRSVTVKARWLPKLDLPLKRRDELTPDKLRDTRDAVRRAINSEKDKYNSEFANLGKLPLVDANLIMACGRRVPAETCQAEGLTDKCVDVEIHPYALSTDPVFMGSVLLPLPRSNQFTFLSHVPNLLRLLNPKFGISHDRKLGTMPDFEISTDLLGLHTLPSNEAAVTSPIALLLKAKGGKSISEPFYSSHAELAFLMRQPNEYVESLGIETSFDANHEPLAGRHYLDNSVRIGGHLALNPAAGLVNRVVLSGGYRRSRDRLSGNSSQAPIYSSENSYEGRAVLEGRFLNGFSRLGFWLDGGKPTSMSKSYGRVAGLIGYEKEIPVAGNTFGLEALFGLGRASDRTPEYRLFYGGNSLNSFLYQETEDPALTSLPSGPLLRSFGSNQAGFSSGSTQRGANSFQHFNLTVSIPIPRFSSPLIPDEVVMDNPRKTLRNLVAFAVNTGQEALSLNLQDQGLSEEEADKKAAKIFGEIRPGIKYLTDYAKIYSLKPILMFDEARMKSAGSANNQTRYAVGGGLQLTVVVAKFEAGYIHSLHRLSGDPRGNFVVRLVFENLF